MSTITLPSGSLTYTPTAEWYDSIFVAPEDMYIVGGIYTGPSNIDSYGNVRGNDNVAHQQLANMLEFLKAKISSDDFRFFTPAPPEPNQILFAMMTTRPFKIPSGLAGSKSFIWSSAATSQQWSIHKISHDDPSTILDLGYYSFNSEVGGLVNSGHSFSSETIFYENDILYIKAPGAPDPSLYAACVLHVEYI